MNSVSVFRVFKSFVCVFVPLNLLLDRWRLHFIKCCSYTVLYGCMQLICTIRLLLFVCVAKLIAERMCEQLNRFESLHAETIFCC